MGGHTVGFAADKKGLDIIYLGDGNLDRYFKFC